ncbi:MAG TPA: cellulase family glycosylhydrolase [Armatimonadota bacterium]|jgi:hypothetical protein
MKRVNKRRMTVGFKAAVAGSSAALLLAAAACRAVPLMDGVRDAEYTVVASNLTAPGHALVVDPSASPAINDPADPRATTLYTNGLWATNTLTDLYLYVDMPNLDLNVIEGEWAIPFHLRGVNDGIQRLGTFGDPYGASCDYVHVPASNAVLKSNMAGFKHDYDGNQGYAFLIAPNKAGTDWSWDNSGFLGNGGWAYDTAGNIVHGTGTSGGEIVYAGAKGIEVKIPLALFGINPGNTNLVAPRIGDEILMQFYANMRNRTSPLYPRGPVDSAPYQASAQGNAATHNYSRGSISQWASYTLRTPPMLEVSGAGLSTTADPGHLVVKFTSAVGAGADTASNYAVVNVGTAAPVPVASAQIDPDDASRVILGLTLPLNSRLRVTVGGVLGTNGALVSSIRNSAELSIGAPVVFNMYDPYGIVAAAGTNPGTGLPYRVTLTGDFIGYANARPPEVMPAGKAYGWNEIPMAPVAGEPAHFRSPAVICSPGVNGYKYCFPEMPDGGSWDGWNWLNPNDRVAFVPRSSSVLQVNDNAAGAVAGTVRDGGPVSMTFTLIDRDNLAAGRPVYLTGTFNGWSGDAAGAVPMAEVAGQPHTYSATFTPASGSGRDVTIKYRYVLIDGAGTEWDLMNPLHDRAALVKGSGAPPRQSVTDYLGSSLFARILRVAAGLGPAPYWSGYYGELDVDFSGDVTFLDAVTALRTASMPVFPRLRAEGVKIVDPTGKEVRLRGFNLGGWFVEEMWMTPWVQDPPGGSPYQKVDDHFALWTVLTQRLGAASAQNVKAAYRNAWIQPSDFKRIKAAGFNSVRLPFIYDIVDEPNGMDWLRGAVRDANAAGLYVILDMHGAPGSQNGWDHSGEAGPVLFFSNTDNIAKAVQVWTTIAQEFGSNPGVLGCDLLNEPAGAPDVATLHSVHNQLYQAIRHVAPDTIVIVEDGYKGVASLPQPAQYGWTNVVYSIHLYDFGATSPQDHLNSLNGQLPGILQVRTSRNVPMYIGEFNLEPNNSSAAMSEYTNTMYTNGLSWNLWTFKTVNTSGPMGYWGYYSNPRAVTPLNPFSDAELALVTKMSQVRTENLTIPSGLAAALTPPGP